MPMLRKLRIAFSAACGIVCLFLIVLWVRSHWVQDVVWGWFPISGYLQLNSNTGHVKMIVNGEQQEPVWQYESRAPDPLRHTWYWNLDRASRFGWWLDITFPLCVPVLLTAALPAALWIRWSRRFSLRTLLIATTLVAVVLGLAVAFR